jgi:hypothetical protein
MAIKVFITNLCPTFDNSGRWKTRSHHTHLCRTSFNAIEEMKMIWAPEKWMPMWKLEEKFPLRFWIASAVDGFEKYLRNRFPLSLWRILSPTPKPFLYQRPRKYNWVIFMIGNYWERNLPMPWLDAPSEKLETPFSFWRLPWLTDRVKISAIDFWILTNVLEASTSALDNLLKAWHWRERS